MDTDEIKAEFQQAGVNTVLILRKHPKEFAALCTYMDGVKKDREEARKMREVLHKISISMRVFQGCNNDGHSLCPSCREYAKDLKQEIDELLKDK